MALKGSLRLDLSTKDGTSSQKLMEQTRRSIVQDSQAHIKMQKQSIEKQKNDIERFKEDLALETRQAKIANNMSASAQIAKLQDQVDLYKRKVEQERIKLGKLNGDIKDEGETLATRSLDTGGINAAREDNQQTHKQIRILENRLDKALIKLNEALAHNKRLHQTIDNLRRERVMFDGIYQRSMDDVAKKKDGIEQLKRERDAAMKAKMKALSQIMEMKEEAKREQENFEAEWAHLSQSVEEDKRRRDDPELQRDRSLNMQDPAMEEAKALRKKVNRGAWAIAKDKTAIHLSMERLQDYDAAFQKIQQQTKIDDMDKLAEAFVEAEEKNFILFNYVNDLTNDLEKVDSQLGAVREELKKFKGHAPGAQDNHRKKIVDALESRKSKVETKGNAFQDRYSQANRTVKGLKDGIATLFVKTGNQGTAAAEMLGTAGVTESNMMQYLGLVEQRINDLLNQYNKAKEPEPEPEPERPPAVAEQEEAEEGPPDDEEEPDDGITAPSTEALEDADGAEEGDKAEGGDGEEYEDDAEKAE